MRQVYVRSPEREHALEYELVKREEPIELRRRSRAFLLAQSAEYDEGHSRRPHVKLPAAGPTHVPNEVEERQVRTRRVVVCTFFGMICCPV